MKSYKGFDKDLKCRGFQYEIGKEYEESEANCCKSGFHACKYPLDVFNYYAPVESRYCEVEQSGNMDTTADDSKVASTKIKIGAELSIADLVRASLDFVLSKIKKDRGKRAQGDYSAASVQGNYSAASAQGNYSAASVQGYGSAASAATGGNIAVACGYKCKAKASIGSAIVVCERGQWNGKEYPLINIKSAIVDGKNLKADTYYTLKNGEFVEAKNDD